MGAPEPTRRLARVVIGGESTEEGEEGCGGDEAQRTVTRGEGRERGT